MPLFRTEQIVRIPELRASSMKRQAFPDVIRKIFDRGQLQLRDRFGNMFRVRFIGLIMEENGCDFVARMGYSVMLNANLGKAREGMVDALFEHVSVRICREIDPITIDLGVYPVPDALNEFIVAGKFEK